MESPLQNPSILLWELACGVVITWVTHLLLVCEYRVQKGSMYYEADILQCERTGTRLQRMSFEARVAHTFNQFKLCLL